MRQPSLIEAYANLERQAMATKAGLGERHGREPLSARDDIGDVCRQG